MSAFKQILDGFVIFTLINVVVAQINGEFWWLNNNFAALHGAEVPEAQFEELDEFANDETDMVVFRDDNVDPHKDLRVDISKSDKNRNKDSEELLLHFPSSEENESVNNSNIYTINNKTVTNIVSQSINYKQTNKSGIQIRNKKYEKIIWPDKGTLSENEVIVFPSEAFKKIKNVQTKISGNPLSNRYNNKKIIQSEANDSNATSDAEYICNYVTKEVCTQRNGFMYNDSRSLKSSGCLKKKTVCCVLPIQSNAGKEKLLQEVLMPENKAETTEVNAKVNIRFPRSARDIATSSRDQKQRDVLLKKVFHNINTKITTSATTILKKIVNPEDDYIDPYWNIKDSNLKSHQKGSRPVVNSYEYDTVQSDEDYASELPKPGLGSYSGQPTRRPLPVSWTDYYINPGPSYYNVYGSAGGNNYNSYTTLDPRQDHRVSLSLKPKPTKPTSEEIYDSESQIVTYHANPDFQVLQDFKFLNLLRNRSRVRDEKSRKSTTEHYYSEESVSVTRPGYGGDSEVVYDEVDGLGKQLHENCRKRTGDYDDSEEIGSGGLSWLTLVVRTRKQRRSLCTATLVHPRAALTAASCVYGASHGEVVIRAGEKDPGKDPQQRLASVYADPLYQPRTINHNLAILYWKRPLRTGTGVQPACLATVVKPEDSCNLIEWDLSKQATRPQIRVQHALVLKRQPCIEHLSKAGILDEVPNGAFCITTQSSRCTLNVGGALYCNDAAVGVAVRRARCDSPSLMLPTYGWTRQALAKLHIV